jgi:hypothetical protein
MSVTVKFSVFFDSDNSVSVDEDEVDEDKLRAHYYALYEAKYISTEPLEGTIEIASPPHQISIYDDLLCSVQGICFDSIIHLVLGQPYTYQYFVADESLTMIPSEASVTITGNCTSSVTIELKTLIFSLYECGKRFIHFSENYLKMDAIVLGGITTQADAARRLMLEIFPEL